MSHFKILTYSDLFQLAVPLKLTLEMPGDGHPKPDAHVSVEVYPLSDGLCTAPLGHDMPLDPDSLSFPIHCPAISHTVPVESGRDVLAILLVEEDDPVVQLLDVGQHIPVVPWLGTIVLKPN